MNRRTFIKSTTAGATVLFAGCASGNNNSSPTQTSAETSTSPPPTTEATTTSPPTTSRPNHEYAPDPWTNIDESSTDTSNTISGEATLEEGQYALRQAQFQRPYTVEVSVAVQEGSSIDVFGMSADEFDRYRDRQTPVYYDGFYETDVSEITITGDLSAGEHRVVFDNSEVFGADPSGAVTFDFETVVSV
jgi:hypothetical protein